MRKKTCFTSAILGLLTLTVAWGEVFAAEGLPAGYTVFPIVSLRFLRAGRDPGLRQVPLNDDADLVTNGTFYNNESTLEPVGTLIQNREIVDSGYSKTRQRGGVAVLEDGKIIVCQQEGFSLGEIQGACAPGLAGLQHFMGGGALLLLKGQKVSQENLSDLQKFDQGGNGIDAEQFRNTSHTLVATRANQAYIVLAIGKTGATMRDDFFAAGFSAVVKFDGGSGFYARNRDRSFGSGSNPTGLLAKIKH